MAPQPVYTQSELRAIVKKMDKAFLMLAQSPPGLDPLTLDLYMLVSERCRDAIRDYYRPKWA